MFAVSYTWILEILGKEFGVGEILAALDSQGFEVKSVDDLDNDHVVTIEVKANRPDMLSHFGVARELAAYFKLDFKEPKFNLDIKNDHQDIFLVNLDKKVCKSYHAICIDGINNNIETPSYIRKRLELFGMESINAVVDISNYVVLEFGQPTHIYDRDRLESNQLNIYKNEEKCEFLDLFGDKKVLEPGDIVISDSEKKVCVAGIIGSSTCETRKSTKNIVIESAVFEKIPIRMTSKRLKTSTLASYRFERGVDSTNSENILFLIASRILTICGGNITHKFDFDSESTKKTIILRVSRTNDILGTDLTVEKIIECLEQYKFECEYRALNQIEVKIPSFRLDIEEEIDLIEEVARGLGYDNIGQKNLALPLVYRQNGLYENMNKLREILIGFGFNEVINYSFVPSSLCKIIGIEKSECVFIQNPLSNCYDLMRPNMMFSLVSSLVYNYSIGNYNLSLFEIGRIYSSNNNSETLSEENDSLGFIMSGTRVEAGFGVVKPYKYDFYDLSSYLHNIFVKFNQKIDFSPKLSPCMKNSYDILSDGVTIGYMGQILPQKFSQILPNIKLIHDEIFYCEIDIRKIINSKKSIRFESKYPSIVRQYNLICSKEIGSNNIVDFIKSCSNSINEVIIKDVYKDKKMDNDSQSILFEIKFRLKDRTMLNDEIEILEANILSGLYKKFGIKIKQ